MRGLVTKSTGSWYRVHTEDGNDVKCRIKGHFRLKAIQTTNPIAIGDYVDVNLKDDGTGVITYIEPRRNYIIRRAANLSRQAHIIAANIDRCFLVVTLSYPETPTTFIDRFLAAAQAYDIPVTIVINKEDTYDLDQLRYADSLVKLYTSIGYPCLRISAVQGQGLYELREQIKSGITLLSGNSGVGKTTLINTLLPNLGLRTRPVSSRYGTGMHTTTYYEMYALPHGGYIIDTPGIKGFGNFDMKEGEISHYFTDIFRFATGCRYDNCTHRNEPGCAVRDAVIQHYISQSRYTSYLSMMAEKDEGKYR